MVRGIVNVWQLYAPPLVKPQNAYRK